VLVRFRLRDLAWGSGGHWVAGGALAISALAFAQVAIADRRLNLLHGATAPLSDIALLLWATAMLWLVPLMLCELLWPRLRYHSRRWSTVFPLGMYAVCSFDVSAATRMPLIGDFARGWVWVAAAGWIVVFLGMVGRGSRLVWQGT
jgi:tellurite resistance protein TehA-like permease